MAGWREEAVLVAKQLIRDLPGRAEPVAVLALAYKRFGLLEKAQTAFKQCLELAPRFADAHHGLGEIAFDRGAYEEAVEHFRRTLELNARMPGARTKLGDALMHLGRIEEAITALKQDIEASSDPAQGHFLLGQAHAQLEQYEDAKLCFEAAIRADDSCTYAYYGLGNACRKLGEREAAMQQLRKFQQLKDKNREAERQRLKGFDDERSVRQGTAFLHNAAATVYARSGEFGKAESCWLRAATLDPSDPLPRSQLAELYLQLNRLADATPLLEELVRFAPDDPGLHMQLGANFASTGRLEEAERAFLEATRLAPDSAAGYVATAQLYMQSGRNLKEAQRLLETAVGREPRAQYYYMLGAVADGNGDPQLALSAVERAAELEPNNQQYQRVRDSLRQQLQTGEEPSP